MKDRFLVPLICLLPALSLLSCASIKDPDFRSIENIRVNRIGSNETTLDLDLHYFNPNHTKLTLKKAEGDAWMDNNFLGHFTIDTLVFIPANADFLLPVKLKVDMSHLVKNSLSVFLNKEVMLRLEGKARIGKASFYINYPIRYEEKQDMRELLRY